MFDKAALKKLVLMRHLNIIRSKVTTMNIDQAVAYAKKQADAVENYNKKWSQGKTGAYTWNSNTYSVLYFHPIAVLYGTLKYMKENPKATLDQIYKQAFS